MNFLVDDGGRAVAGFKGKAGDCVVRAIAIATERPYLEIYDAINREGKQESRRHARRSTARGGVFKLTFKRYLLGLGWHWIPTMKIGQGCRVHLRSAELPSQGRLIVSLSRHLTAVVDGVIHDTYDPSRHGTRCVYGYFSRDAVELPAPLIPAPDDTDAMAAVQRALSGYTPKEKLLIAQMIPYLRSTLRKPNAPQLQGGANEQK